MKIQDKIEKILSLSKADDCVVIATENSNANVRWANNTSTTNGCANTSRVSVISVIDGAVGTVSSTYFPDDELEGLVRRSEGACKGRPKAPDQMPFVRSDGSKPSDWDEPYERSDMSLFRDVNEELGMLFKRAGSEDVLLFGFASQSAYTSYLATSAGFRGRFSKLFSSFQMNAKSPDYKKSVSHTSHHSKISEAEPDKLYERMSQRMQWSERSIPQDAGHYQVILEPAAVNEILTYMWMQWTARDADEGRTALSKPGGGNKIGEKLFPDLINLYSDPNERGLETAPYEIAVGGSSRGSIFDNGTPTERVDWIRNGVVNALVTPRYWAAKRQTEPVIDIPNGVLVGDESKSLDEMISSSDRALLVTRFWYTRLLDPQRLVCTGLTRDGVFLVENGEVTGAVNNFRYNMSPLATLAQTAELGPTEKASTTYRVATLRVDDFHMSSVSEAS